MPSFLQEQSMCLCEELNLAGRVGVASSDHSCWLDPGWKVQLGHNIRTQVELATTSSLLALNHGAHMFLACICIYILYWIEF